MQTIPGSGATSRGDQGDALAGRLELSGTPPVLIDGAHNPHAAAVLAVYLRKALDLYGRIILVMGVMGDKDGGIIKPLLPLRPRSSLPRRLTQGCLPGFACRRSPCNGSSENRSHGFRSLALAKNSASRATYRRHRIVLYHW